MSVPMLRFRGLAGGANRRNVLAAALRHPPGHPERGSVRFEWLLALVIDSRAAPAGLDMH